MNCECQVCTDIVHLQECGVSEDFINRWLNEGTASGVAHSILDGSWPNAVEQLEEALENAKKMRG